MKTLPDFSAIIFDLDGLVLDTEITYVKAWQEAAEIMGYESCFLTTQALSGLHYQAVIEFLLNQFGTNFDLQRFNKLSGVCWRNYVQKHGIQKKTGFDELLAVIEQFNIPFCLATNSAEINARECLTLAGLAGVFSILISRDDVQQGKPAPDIFLVAAKRLQQPIAQCLVLEDSWVGVAAAQSAGAMTILIPSTWPILASKIDKNVAICADLNQVVEIIRAMPSLQINDN